MLGLIARCVSMCCFIASISVVNSAFAQDVQDENSDDQAFQIMERAWDQSRQHHNQQSKVVMEILDSKKRKKKRYFEFKYKIIPDKKVSRGLIRFYRPASIKGTGLLSIIDDSIPTEATQQFIYLPAARTTRSLRSDEKHQSFMGSDLTNADMAGRKPKQDDHEVIRTWSESSENGEQNYVLVESRPIDEADLYSRLVTKIWLDIYVPVEIKFYDKEDKLLKTLINTKIGYLESMYYPIETMVNNHQTGGSTVLTRESYRVNATIGENEVGLRGLRSR